MAVHYIIYICKKWELIALLRILHDVLGINQYNTILYYNAQSFSQILFILFCSPQDPKVVVSMVVKLECSLIKLSQFMSIPFQITLTQCWNCFGQDRSNSDAIGQNCKLKPHFASSCLHQCYNKTTQSCGQTQTFRLSSLASSLTQLGLIFLA